MMIDTNFAELPRDLPEGVFVFCPNCLPMIVSRHYGERLPGHITDEDPEARGMVIREGSGRVLEHVWQYIPLFDAPGAVLVEYLTEDDGSVQFCTRCMAGIMSRVRYAPGVRLYREYAK